MSYKVSTAKRKQPKYLLGFLWLISNANTMDFIKKNENIFLIYEVFLPSSFRLDFIFAWKLPEKLRRYV